MFKVPKNSFYYFTKGKNACLLNFYVPSVQQFKIQNVTPFNGALANIKDNEKNIDDNIIWSKLRTDVWTIKY